MERKKVLLIIIDGLSPSEIGPAIDQGRLPTFERLAGRGVIRHDCCSIFPSITHAALASIVTGEYPINTGILGTIWFEKDQQEAVYYGAQFWLVLKQGVDKFLEDLLAKYNEERLKADTVFQRLERAGHKTASLNFLVYKGDNPHHADEPTLMKLIPGVEMVPTLYGPSIFFLGDFVHPVLASGEPPLDLPGGPTELFGINDRCTAAALEALAERDAFPDFTLAYFPENDVREHKVGPTEAVDVLIDLDARLNELFLSMGGLDKVLEEFAILIHGDHAQLPMKDADEDAAILVTKLLPSFKVRGLDEKLHSPSDAIIAPNLRVAFVYLGEATPEHLLQASADLLADPRIDQVFWEERLFRPETPGFRVMTADRGEIWFWKGSNGANTAADDYGCEWSWEGSQRALDFSVMDGRLVWGDYPNAFERIACGVGPVHAGHLWATARPGYGFKLPGTGAHEGGGSHASLHREDSMTTLIAAGLPEGVEVPDSPRIIDTVPLILQMFGLNGLQTCTARFKGHEPQVIR